MIKRKMNSSRKSLVYISFSKGKLYISKLSLISQLYKCMKVVLKLIQKRAPRSD